MTHRGSRERLRKQIAFKAACLLREGRADDAETARRMASRQLVRGWTPANAMPPSQDVHEVMRQFAGPSASSELPQPYAAYRAILLPLAHVRMPKATHPEGDALYHSLQTFERVRQADPYDEELLTAALLHEVGRAVDVVDPIAATLDVLDGLITQRTAWFIAELPEERRRLDCDLGQRASRRLARHADGDALTTLARGDAAARVCGGAAPSLDEALQSLSQMDRAFDEETDEPPERGDV